MGHTKSLNMNMKIATTLALLGCALESATATFVLSGTAATVGSSTALTLGTGSTIYATSALVGGVVLIKALALAGLAVAASRSRLSLRCLGRSRTRSMLPSSDLRFGYRNPRKV